MSVRIRIAVDAMSGDLGPRVAILAAQKFTAIYSDVDIVLVGNEQKIAAISPVETLLAHRISILHAQDVVVMNEKPLFALRHKRQSSMWIALNALSSDVVDGCVSAGNTAVLLAMGSYLINTFPGVDRPAICKAMPVESGQTYLLDLGANLNCTADNLYQFALMGNVLASSVNSHPRIALLNVGVEESKGTEIIKSAQDLLVQDTRVNYVGFVEANTIFSGDVDVIVCDGFSGNVALKSCEGTAQFILRKLRAAFARSLPMRMLGLLVFPLIKQLRADLDPSMYNGASFLGLQKVLVKSHGGADVKAFTQALVVAREQIIFKIPARIGAEFLNSPISKINK